MIKIKSNSEPAKTYDLIIFGSQTLLCDLYSRINARENWIEIDGKKDIQYNDTNLFT